MNEPNAAIEAKDPYPTTSVFSNFWATAGKILWKTNPNISTTKAKINNVLSKEILKIVEILKIAGTSNNGV